MGILAQRVGVWVLIGLFGAGCRQSSQNSTAVAKGPPAGTRYLELVSDPEGCRFVATVEFDRVQVLPASRASDGSIITYYTELKPIKLIQGSWDLSQNVTVQSGPYLATAENKDWIGVLVKDQSGQDRWFTEFFLRNGRLYEGGTEEFVATEPEAPKIIQTYLRENGVR
jgi:hypothetical protein